MKNIEIVCWLVIIMVFQIKEVKGQISSTRPFDCELDYYTIQKEIAKRLCPDFIPPPPIIGCLIQEGDKCLDCEADYYLDGEGQCIDIYLTI